MKKNPHQILTGLCLAAVFILTGCAKTQKVPVARTPVEKPVATTTAIAKVAPGLNAASANKFSLPPETIIKEIDETFKLVAEPKHGKTFSYQWERNRVAITNETNDTLDLIAKPEMVGLYRCRLTDTNPDELEVSYTVEVAVYVISNATPKRLVSNITTVTGPLVVQGGNPAGNCPGSYYGYTVFYTTAGSRWFPAPSGCPSVSAKDITANIPAGYNSAVEIVRSDLVKDCKLYQQSANVPTSGTRKFQFTIYEKGTQLTPGTPITVQITWN